MMVSDFVDVDFGKRTSHFMFKACIFCEEWKCEDLL